MIIFFSSNAVACSGRPRHNLTTYVQVLVIERSCICWACENILEENAKKITNRKERIRKHLINCEYFWAKHSEEAATNILSNCHSKEELEIVPPNKWSYQKLGKTNFKKIYYLTLNKLFVFIDNISIDNMTLSSSLSQASYSSQASGLSQTSGSSQASSLNQALDSSSIIIIKQKKCYKMS